MAQESCDNSFCFFLVSKDKMTIQHVGSQVKLSRKKRWVEKTHNGYCDTKPNNGKYFKKYHLEKTDGWLDLWLDAPEKCHPPRTNMSRWTRKLIFPDTLGRDILVPRRVWKTSWFELSLDHYQAILFKVQTMFEVDVRYFKESFVKKEHQH